jgi:acyl-CoA hydrolase
MRVVEASALDLAGLIRPGEAVVCGQACGEPLTLLEALAAQRERVSGISVFIGASFAGIFKPDHADHLRFQSFGALGTNRSLAKAGVLGLIPCHVARLGPYFTQGTLACDVLLVQVSPAGPDGLHSFGVTADYVRAAADKARLVIAEINDQVPRTCGHLGLRADEIDIAVHTSRPLPAVAGAAAAATDTAIAGYAAAFIGDEAVLQIGIGATPDAILRALSDRRNLGFHSGMMSDAVVDLIQCGALTNARKPIDVGVSVTGALIGTSKLYDFAADNRAIALRESDYTHGDLTLGALDTLVTINSAIEVDLSGQVNAEQVGDDYLGGIGGQADFVRAGHRAARGHAIIALPSAARGGVSRIVPRLGVGASTARTDVDIVVTEYGAAELRGQTLAERARRLIGIAHPDCRGGLEEAAFAVFRRGY